MSKSNDNKNNEIKLGNITLIHNEKGLAITPNDNHLFMSADEMFKELGYEENEGLYEICYGDENRCINFNKKSKTVEIYKDEYEDFITMQELKAINIKCKELKWI